MVALLLMVLGAAGVRDSELRRRVLTRAGDAGVVRRVGGGEFGHGASGRPGPAGWRRRGGTRAQARKAGSPAGLRQCASNCGGEVEDDAPRMESADHSSHGKRRSYAGMARAARRTSNVSTASACVLLLATVLVSCVVAESQNKTVWVGGVHPAVHWHPGHPGCTHAPAPAINRAAPETVIELCEPGQSGPNCSKDTYSQSFGVGCSQPCTVNSCSKHGRCRGRDGSCIFYEGWHGDDRSEPRVPAECDGEFAGPECLAQEGVLGGRLVLVLVLVLLMVVVAQRAALARGWSRQGRGMLLLCLVWYDSLLGACATTTRLTTCRQDRCCRVEVYYSGSWGTVCDDYFGDVDARVVCREVGCLAEGASQVQAFGGGSGQIWMDNVACSGSESGLSECGHLGWGYHNCGHHEDVGVCCRSAPGSYSSDGQACSQCPAGKHSSASGSLPRSPIVCQMYMCVYLVLHANACPGTGGASRVCLLRCPPFPPRSSACV